MKALTDRERLMALAAALTLGSAVIAARVLGPMWDHAQRLQAQVTRMSGQLHAAQRTSRAGAVGSEAAALIQQERLALQDPQPQLRLFEELDVLARQSGVRLDLRPSASEEPGVLAALEGGQAQVLAFLDAVMGMRRLISIEQVRLTGGGGAAGSVRMELALQLASLEGMR